MSDLPLIPALSKIYVPAPDGSPAVPGVIEAMVRADVTAMGSLSGGTRRTYAELAFLLANQIDRAKRESAPAAVIAQLAKVLSTVLAEVNRNPDDSRRRDDLSSLLGMPTPVGDASHDGPANPGTERRPAGEGAGAVVDALAATRGERGPGDRLDNGRTGVF